MRLRRARALGIDDKSYASIRAATGRDIVALLFSSNALGVDARLATIPADEAAKLATIGHCGRLSLLHPPVNPARFTPLNPVIDAAAAAPDLRDGGAATRDKVLALTGARGFPGNGVVVIGDTGLEREWALAGRLAGFQPSGALVGG